MAVFRVNKTADYTIMGNQHLREKELSLKAKGLLSLMLSLPNDWDYSVLGLVSICKESKNTIITILDELKKFGYLTITKKLPNETDSGRFEYEYNIFEYPQAEEETEEAEETIEEAEKNDRENSPKQAPKKQDLEIGKQAPKKQDLEKQDIVFCTQLNTNILNTNKQKTKDIYTYVVEAFNSICTSLPKVKEITEKRKKTIRARLVQYPKEQIEEVFAIAEASDFLKGANGKWKATFDWLMNENNFVKVLEGNYNNKTQFQPQQTKQSEYDSFMSGLAEFVKENSE